MVEYITHCITLVIFGNGRFQVQANELLECGDYDCDQVNQVFKELESAGWKIVGIIDRNPCNGPLKALEVYFRREKQLYRTERE